MVLGTEIRSLPLTPTYFVDPQGCHCEGTSLQHYEHSSSTKIFGSVRAQILISEGNPLFLFPEARGTREKRKHVPMWVLRMEGILVFLLLQNANEALFAPRHRSSHLSVMHKNDHVLSEVGKQFHLAPPPCGR